MPSAADRNLISATEACALLGVSSATLYAYVSRGLLSSRAGSDHRSRTYLRAEVERLAQRKRAGRGAARGAAQSLDRGLPVLETRISLIRPDSPYYRGRSAVAAVRAGAGLEDIARLLWECQDEDPFAAAPVAPWPPRVAPLAGDTTLPPLERAMACIPLLALELRQPLNAAPTVRREIAATLLRQNAALLVGTAPDTRPVHRLIADHWRPGDADFAELVRAALVLCADHELNVSAFAARVVASTGAPLHATVSAGLAALSGPRHGGATARAHALLRDAQDATDPAAFVAERWQRGDDLPGFHHALYPHGDPRAADVLRLLRERCGQHPQMRHVETVLAAAQDCSGQAPNIDGMLAALCLIHDLPAAHALVLFAAARLSGWLAHALEQQALGKLIRPRARYAGVMPDGVASG
ncbi:citrate synthase family protein [Xanthomonas translucens]|uniref:citrate synthase family protein n=3 Tax=Xanthomonas campestris pv. translucens TaxID=343 RepID=UPI0006421702|nr:citrate synthase family protein [Xanthomonas translucens]AKK66806.1 citrate synthase [Xanthomonas translucens pv. undulosa]MCT8270837.1 citrate synthase family protein [Xanthomonas translucens pv. undulosa]QEO25591.1 helix-turn-helix domain-containing protein [Xanthomonas translucens pv. undulosa]WNJ30164.1 citrate synthase family protein [Xanthomonas translucens pv. undulosa]